MHCLQGSCQISKSVSRELDNSLRLLFRSCGTSFAAAAAVNGKPEQELNEKLVKVAIIGKTNAGKSTLINKMLNLNVCDVSTKAHTTLMPLKAAFVSGSTQVVFVDTPGLPSKKEMKKFKLREKMPEWQNTVFENVDVVGAVHDVSYKGFRLKLHPNIRDALKKVPQSKTVALIVNKMDLIENKSEESKIVEAVNKITESSSTFSQVFFTSALKNEGVKELKNFLLEKAVPGKWLIKAGDVSDTPLAGLIQNLTRAQCLDCLRNEIPYTCKYEVQYLEEDEIGNYRCVVIVICKKANYLKIILNPKLQLLKTVCKNLKSQLFFLTGKEFKIKLIFQSSEFT